MFGKDKKKKKLDAQVMPIEDRIESLETTKAHNEEAQVALLEAIDKELSKISEHADGTSRCKRKQKK